MMEVYTPTKNLNFNNGMLPFSLIRGELTETVHPPLKMVLSLEGITIRPQRAQVWNQMSLKYGTNVPVRPHSVI